MLWHAALELLAANPLLLLFLTAAIGYPIGRISILGTRIGVSSVLFAGLALGALDPRIKLPEIIYQVGLVLFVYPVALSSGPSFFAAFRRKGLRDNLLVAAVLVVSAVTAVLVGHVVDLDAPTIAGLFSGALTNTPALAAVIETIRSSSDAATFEALRVRPVVGYSIAYPMGVLAVIGAITVAQRLWKIDYRREAASLQHLNASSAEITHRTIRVTNRAATRQTLRELAAQQEWSAVFTRCKVGDVVEMVAPDWIPSLGARLIAVGSVAELDRVQQYLGERSADELDVDRRKIDYRRIVLSNRALAGRTLKELQLDARFGGVVTRLRRGDVELMPDRDTVLELGDRLRVVARKDQLDAIGKYFGDSYRALSEVDVATFSLGLFLGLLVGMIPFPLPGGISVRLGLAGGPLIIGLLLGARGFTGRLVWTLPYSANLTIRQVGLVLFLAGIGTQAGYAFVDTLITPAGLSLMAAGATITLVTAIVLLILGHLVFRIPMSLLTGMVAGMHTQPAVLSYAGEQTGNDLPNVGYATVYPTAFVAKIILAQLILALA
jgi:putative transport protein